MSRAGGPFSVNTPRGAIGYLTGARRRACNGNRSTHRRGTALDCEPSSYDALIRPVQEQMLRSIWRITRRGRRCRRRAARNR